MTHSTATRIYLDSTGCRLNQSEMESLARQLAGQGRQIVAAPAQADLCILNTCAVTREAERKSRQMVRRVARAARHANPDVQVLLTGCYATLSPAEMSALPGVSRVVNNVEKEKLLTILEPDGQAPAEPTWQLPDGRTRALVKVQDGCDNRCTFCVTTIARGPGRSRPPAEVLAEIQALQAAGYQEAVLTGVHLGSYGQERGGGKRQGTTLQTLIQTILSQTSIPRLRLSSLEPWDLEPAFFELWQNPRLCRQLHLPLQSGSAGVLRRMGRRTMPGAYRALATAALDAIPDLALTTDLIVGFPGESEAEFEQSLAFVREIEFARLHVFGYSPRPGTAAARMEGQLPRSIIKERSKNMRELGTQKQELFLRRFLGRTLDVLWESPAGENLWRGHTDNYIRVTAASPNGELLCNTITPTSLIEVRPGGIVGSVKPDAHPATDGRFNVELANDMARLESYNKHHYRPNSYLHKWWARRCGSTFRLILKALVEEEKQRDYYAAGGLEGKIILDPMMGGGTTLHEAIRLGANVIGADLDPIPVLQARASLTPVPLEQLEAAFADFYSALCRELAPLFCTTCPICQRPSEMKFTLYGARRACRCGPAVLVDSFILRHESDNSVIRICPLCRAITRNNKACRCPSAKSQAPLIEKGAQVCHTCGAPYKEAADTLYYARYEPLAVVGQCKEHNLFFAPPSPADLGRLAQANAMRPNLPPDDFSIHPGPKSADLLRRGIANYWDLFSSRQLLYLQHARALLPADPLIRLNLALLISTSLEFNSMLCGYKGSSKHRPGAIRHTLSHHAYSFPYTALENNPLYPQKASGTLQKLFHDRIRRARRWAAAPVERVIKDGKARTVIIQGEKDAGKQVHHPAELQVGTHRFLLIQGSSADLNLEPDSVDYIVTDPPYFDNVQYSDLAAFFRVWLKEMLPDAARWEVDLAESAAAGSHACISGQYTRVLSAIFAECYRVLRKERGRLVFTFHHWNPKGWTALTLALKRAGFVLLNHYTVHAENPTSVHIANLKALTHDAILVLAPAGAGLAPAWPRPAAVDKSDSAQFCQDCASVLGWVLNANLEEAEIEEQWSNYV